VDKTPAVSLTLAEFVANTAYESLPERTVYMTKRCILDAIGVSLAASGMGEGCRAFVGIALAQGGHPICSVFGESTRVPVEAAAFANGSMAHALDYEDAHDATLLHPNAPTIPAALAVAEAFGPVSGREFITAVAVGCDVTVRLGLALKVSMSDYGWYPPPILAAFGATAAVSRLLRLSASQVRDAFSLTLCQATCSGEIKYSPDSVIRAVRDAFASRAAVTSALLAKKDVTGFDFPFEGRAGFFAMYARGAYDPGALVHELGKTFEMDNISFKPWPSCRGTHSAIEGVLALRAAHRIDPAEVVSVSLRGSGIMRMLNEPRESKRRPTTSIDAKFSLPFTVAAALVLGRVTLQEFLPSALGNGEVLRLAEKVDLEIDALVPEHDIGCSVKVNTRAGDCYVVRVDAPLGHPTHPMSEAAFLAKFVDCARYATRPVDAAAAVRVCEAVVGLDLLGDVGAELMPLLRRWPERQG
jgi:2-methylcitrate dehydratase PrpD